MEIFYVGFVVCKIGNVSSKPTYQPEDRTRSISFIGIQSRSVFSCNVNSIYDSERATEESLLPQTDTKART